ncbi:MAG: ABC transporter ATP-binding protein [Bacteroidales bacterium]|jgi:ABC-type multidrug transport system ATPase subunit|nr:ABC transporter ATP-binding protein [Bacteroidales bacterium]
MESVVVDNVKKCYGQVIALKGVSFSAHKGEIFGLIGPDGSGKSTLFKIMTTLLLPDSGTVEVAGYDVLKDYAEIRNIIGYMPSKFSLYKDLSVEENMKFFATLFKTTIQENYYLVKDIYSQIEPFKKRKARNLSGGMKQKLALSCALIHKPSVLFLDEPTTGVDPVSRKDLWTMLKKLSEQEITIIVSTPYMDEAKLCDRIALIKEGEFMKIDTPDGIVNSLHKKVMAVRGENMYLILNALRTLSVVEMAFAFGETNHITLKDSASDLSPADIVRMLEDKGFNNVDVKEIRAGVEDCYMVLSKENI